MIKLNVNEEKQLTFQVQIGGVNYDQVVSHFRINLEGIEYGFPAKVTKDAIVVDLPVLSKVIGKKIKEGEEVGVKLETIADGHYLTPWQDTARLSNPLVVEAKIIGDTFVANPSLQTRLVVTEDGAKQRTTMYEKIEESEDFTEKIVNRLASKLSKLFVKEQTLPEKEKAKQEEDEDTIKDAIETVSKEKEEQSTSPAPMKESGIRKAKPQQKKVSESDEDSKMKNMIYNTLRKLHSKESLTESVAPSPTTSPTPKPKKVNIQELKQKLTKQDILNYMAKKGTKNVKVQEVIFNKASEKAKSGEMFDVLQEVALILNSKRK
jgi:hypothetical protein